MMTNEWAEFKAYTEQPIYTAERRTDTTYLGRFTFDMITEFTGFGRVLTTIARGYLFHDKDGAVLDGNPYERIDIARNALYAWCSVPDKKKNSEPPVDFRELSADYPELVDENGNGWFYRHIILFSDRKLSAFYLRIVLRQSACVNIPKVDSAQGLSLRQPMSAAMSYYYSEIEFFSDFFLFL